MQVFNCENMTPKREKMVREIAEKFPAYSVTREDGKVLMHRDTDHPECSDGTARGLVRYLRHNYFDFKPERSDVLLIIDTNEYPDFLKGKWIHH